MYVHKISISLQCIIFHHLDIGQALCIYLLTHDILCWSSPIICYVVLISKKVLCTWFTLLSLFFLLCHCHKGKIKTYSLHHIIYIWICFYVVVPYPVAIKLDVPKVYPGTHISHIHQVQVHKTTFKRY